MNNLSENNLFKKYQKRYFFAINQSNTNKDMRHFSTLKRNLEIRFLVLYCPFAAINKLRLQSHVDINLHLITSGLKHVNLKHSKDRQKFSY